MNKKSLQDWAQLLSGRRYGKELELGERMEMELQGFMIIYGASDDVMHLEGRSGEQEASAYNGDTYQLRCDIRNCGLFLIDKSYYDEDLVEEFDIPFFTLEAVWDDNYPNWTYKTNISEEFVETFNIYEGVSEDAYCKGLVIDVVGAIGHKKAEILKEWRVGGN